MRKLRDYDRLVLNMLLAGDQHVLGILRKQALQVVVSKRTYSSAGEYVDFALPANVELASPENFILQDVELIFKNVNDSVTILLYVERGKLSFLEFAPHGVGWPAEPKVIKAHYLREVQIQPGTNYYEPVQLRDQSTLSRALLGRGSTNAA